MKSGSRLHAASHWRRFGIGSRASPQPKSTKRDDAMDFQKFLEVRVQRCIVCFDSACTSCHAFRRVTVTRSRQRGQHHDPVLRPPRIHREMQHRTAPQAHRLPSRQSLPGPLPKLQNWRARNPETPCLQGPATSPPTHPHPPAHVAAAAVAAVAAAVAALWQHCHVPRGLPHTRFNPLRLTPQSHSPVQACNHGPSPIRPPVLSRLCRDLAHRPRLPYPQRASHLRLLRVAVCSATSDP